ncbi:MAG: tyrosine--tRNA ligase [Nitrospirae bacterium]|nr:tyrosine--tRNA ligase [Candidatus Troglogloeales bacterium]MBI3598569.1 tyrosine--tRNA ligase [Candidatus Troglogloeales bacterium]
MSLPTPTLPHKGEGHADTDFNLLSRGTVDIFQPAELLKNLKRSKAENKPLRIKAGFDPTAPDLHLGHTVLFHKMRQFQELGHEVIFLIGDFTGMIGDPSFRSETRTPLTREAVLKNAQTYQEQVFKILDRQKTHIRFNSEWMGKMTAEQMITLAGQYTVARILERDDFKKRYQQSLPISIHEFLYPLIQGHDSVVLESDVELGGTDQTFNLLVGRELQKIAGKPPQVVMTLPLLEGLDGEKKMSKSFNNAIALEDPPFEMFGKVMSIRDELMLRYYSLLTDENIEDIKLLHPMVAKQKLGRILVERFHGKRKANLAQEQFDITVGRKRGESEELFLNGASISLIDLLCKEGWVKSRGEARRLILQGGVELDSEKVMNPNITLTLAPLQSHDLKVGKKIRRLLKRGVQEP